MKVKVTKPGTVVWDAEQGVVVQDVPIQVKATEVIRSALSSKLITEVFEDDSIETTVSQPAEPVEADVEQPEAEVQQPEAEAEQSDDLPKNESKKLNIKK
jgi:hypothetical protein